jgi:hypothetical protein
MNRTVFGFLCITIFIFGSIHCYAGRPLVTEDAVVAGKGINEIELSYDSFYWSSTGNEHLYLLYLNYGLMNRWQVSVDIPYISLNSPLLNDRNGWGDIVLSSKLLLFKESRKLPSIALLGSIKTKSGDEKDGFGIDEVFYGFLLSASKNYNDVFIHGMLGHKIANGQFDFLTYGIAIEYFLSNRFNIAAEIVGDNFIELSIIDPVAALFGGAYAFSDNFTLDSGISIGLSQAAPDWNLTMGMYITF